LSLNTQHISQKTALNVTLKTKILQSLKFVSGAGSENQLRNLGTVEINVAESVMMWYASVVRGIVKTVIRQS
jgi:hypothetical protein